MQGVNKVILLGWMGHDPELSYTAAQRAVVKFSLATHRYTYDEQGERKQHVDWHKIICHEQLAEFCSQKLQKGSKVYVEGLLEYRLRNHREHKAVKIEEALVVAKQIVAMDGLVLSEYPDDFPELEKIKKQPKPKESAKKAQIEKDLFE